jgi:enterochelin esterase-like enzyme
VDAHEVSVIPGTVESIYLRGPTIGHFRDQILVYLPPGYREHPFNRYPVLYLLHGVPGDPQNFLDIGDVATISDDLVATRQIRPMIIVMPSGGRSFFQDNEWANLAEPNEGWDTFVSRDLVHLIDQRYRTHGVGRECGIAGDSEGAYGALNIAFHHVGEFDLIEGWSPYYKADTRRAVLFEKNKALLAYNSPGEEIVNVAPSLRRNHTYIWLYDGTKERINEGSAQFAAALGRLGVAHAFTQYPGHHDWSLWRAHMPSALITASNYFSHGEPTTA